MLSAAGPSAVPLVVELAAAILVAAGLLARRRIARATAIRRRAAVTRPHPRRA